MITRFYLKNIWWDIKYTYQYERCNYREIKAYITFLLSMLIIPFIIPIDIILLPFELLFILFDKIMKKILDK